MPRDTVGLGDRSRKVSPTYLTLTVRLAKRAIIHDMRRNLVYRIAGILVLLGAWWVLDGCVSKDTLSQQETSAQDYKHATYRIDGRPMTLTNGVSAMEAAPGSAATIVTRAFGPEVRKDLDGDGREDVVFLLTQATGGSGTFF